LSKFVKKIILSISLFLLIPISPAHAILTNYKYSPDKQAIISAEFGTWHIGNNGNPVDKAYDKQHLDEWLGTKGLLDGNKQYLVYFSPRHGQIDVCKAYRADCYAFYEFIYVDKNSSGTGINVNWMKFSDGKEEYSETAVTIAPSDGTVVPPAPNHGIDLENAVKNFSGNVYLDSKLPENILKNTPKLVDFAIAGSSLTGDFDRTQLPAGTNASGAYLLKGITRMSSQGKYIDSVYTVSVKKRVDNDLLEKAIPAVCAASLANPASAVAGLVICGPNAAEILKKADEEIWLMGETNVTIAADGTISDQDIVVKEVRISAVDKALSSAIRTVAGFVQEATKFVMNAINSLLTETANYVVGNVGDTSNTRGVLGPWTAMRNIGLSLLVLALIIIAFANVLQIDIEQYGLGRMIPKIIMSIFLAMASWIIVVFFFDFTQALQQQAIGLVGGSNGLSSLGNMSITVPSTGDILGKLGGLLLLIAIFVGILLCGVVLFFTLILRIVMLSLLLAVAPLAFILNVVPFTANLYKMWWTEFWKWMFMGPVALLIIALGSVIAASASGGQTAQGLSGIDASTVTSSDSGVRMLIGLIIFAGSLFVAATLPLKWGGGIMKGWSKLGKGIQGKLGGNAVKQGWTDFGKARADRGALRYSEMRAGLANKVPGGRLLTGTNKAQAASLKEGIDKTYEGMFSKLDATELAKNAQAGGRKGMIATKVMQSKYGDGTKAWATPGQVNADGTWNTDDPLERKQWDKDAKDASISAYSSMMGQDRDFLKSTIDDNPEMALNVARSMQTTNPQLASQIAGEVNSGSAGKSWSQKNRKQVGAVTKDFKDLKKSYEEQYGASSPQWANLAAEAQKKNAEGVTEGSEARTSALMALGLNSYQAGQMVAAADLRTSWDEQKNRKQTDRIIANSDDKRKGTIEAFDRDVHF